MAESLGVGWLPEPIDDSSWFAVDVGFAVAVAAAVGLGVTVGFGSGDAVGWAACESGWSVPYLHSARRSSS